MSKIYDALTKLEKRNRSHPIPFFPGNWTTSGPQPGYFRRRSGSIEQQVIGTVLGLMIVFGLVLVIAVHQLAGRALRNQVHQRALVAATNLSDAAAGHVLGRNKLELHVLVSKYIRLDGSAYAFVEDHGGEVLAHTLPTFPPELNETLTSSERRRADRRIVSFQGKTVHETWAPILEGQAGAARIGIWEESVASEVRRALLPITGTATGLVLTAALLTLCLVQEFFRRLTGMADDPRTPELSPAGTELSK